MFQVTQLSGFGGNLTPPTPTAFEGLTFKGRGMMRDTSSLTANYGTVDEGSAPVAGDVVLWLASFYTSVGSSSPGAMSGWQGTFSDGGSGGTQKVLVASKVVDASDIASPPSLGSVTTGAMVAYWAAFTVTGLPPTIAASSINGSYTGNSATGGQAADSSALNPPAVAITWAVGGGEDGSLTFSGITMDKTTIWDNYFGNADVRFGHKLDVGGASYSISKGDDGGSNSVFAGYVSAS